MHAVTELETVFVGEFLNACAGQLAVEFLADGSNLLLGGELIDDDVFHVGEIGFAGFLHSLKTGDDEHLGAELFGLVVTAVSETAFKGGTGNSVHFRLFVEGPADGFTAHQTFLHAGGDAALHVLHIGLGNEEGAFALCQFL